MQKLVSNFGALRMVAQETLYDLLTNTVVTSYTDLMDVLEERVATVTLFNYMYSPSNAPLLVQKSYYKTCL